jgi:hypothetical protein
MALIYMNYKFRTELLDKLLGMVTDNIVYKFYILSLLHYGVIIGLYILLLFGYWQLFSVILALQILFNIMDNGCFLMKLERRYIGKDWYGIFGMLGIMNKRRIVWIYWISVIFTIFLIYTVRDKA